MLAFHALKEKPNKKSRMALARRKKRKMKRKETKTETFKHLSAMSMVEPFQICVVIIQHWGPNRRLVNRFYLQPLRKNPLAFFFSLLQRRVCKEGPSGRASKAHCLVLLITPLFVLIMAASRMFLFRNTILPHQTHSSMAQM